MPSTVEKACSQEFATPLSYDRLTRLSRIPPNVSSGMLLPTNHFMQNLGRTPAHGTPLPEYPGTYLHAASGVYHLSTASMLAFKFSPVAIPLLEILDHSSFSFGVSAPIIALSHILLVFFMKPSLYRRRYYSIRRVLSMTFRVWSLRAPFVYRLGGSGVCTTSDLSQLRQSKCFLTVTNDCLARLSQNFRMPDKDQQVSA